STATAPPRPTPSATSAPPTSPPTATANGRSRQLHRRSFRLAWDDAHARACGEAPGVGGFSALRPTRAEGSVGDGEPQSTIASVPVTCTSLVTESWVDGM